MVHWVKLKNVSVIQYFHVPVVEILEFGTFRSSERMTAPENVFCSRARFSLAAGACGKQYFS